MSDSEIDNNANMLEKKATQNIEKKKLELIKQNKTFLKSPSKQIENFALRKVCPNTGFRLSVFSWVFSYINNVYCTH